MVAIFVDVSEPKLGGHNKITWRTSHTSFEKNLKSGPGGDAIIRLLQC